MRLILTFPLFTLLPEPKQALRRTDDTLTESADHRAARSAAGRSVLESLKTMQSRQTGVANDMTSESIRFLAREK